MQFLACLVPGGGECFSVADDVLGAIGQCQNQFPFLDLGLGGKVDVDGDMFALVLQCDICQCKVTIQVLE